MRVLVFAAVLALGEYVGVSWSLEAVIFLGSWAVVFDFAFSLRRWAWSGTRL